MALVTNPEFQAIEESRQMLANLALESHLRATLRADPRTSKMRITISADKGKVTLAGILERGLEPADASDVAAKVANVNDITNLLKVAMSSRIKIDS